MKSRFDGRTFVQVFHFTPVEGAIYATFGFGIGAFTQAACSQTAGIAAAAGIAAVTVAGINVARSAAERRRALSPA